MSDTERDDLRSAIGGVLVNASNFPPKVQFRMLGQDMSPLIERVVDALHAAGYRKPVAVEGDAGTSAERLKSIAESGAYRGWMIIEDYEVIANATALIQSQAATIARVREAARDALANADDAEVGWDAEMSATALLAIVDASPEKGGQD